MHANIGNENNHCIKSNLQLENAMLNQQTYSENKKHIINILYIYICNIFINKNNIYILIIIIIYNYIYCLCNLYHIYITIYIT